MRQVLVCKNCHSDLTKPVKISYGFSKQFDDGSNSVSAASEGQGLRHKASQWSIEHQKLELQSVVWLNLLDVTEDVQKDNSYLGCCGLYGGPNTLCKCGTVIGSEYSDCGGGLSRFQPDENYTFWMEYIVQEKKREYERSERIKADKKAAALFPTIQRDYYV